MVSKGSIKVFLADDSRQIRQRMNALLATAHMDVVGEAATPGTCIAGILDSHPDVVVLDVQLEGGSGLEVLKAVRSADPAVAFVVFSNNSAPAYRKRYLGEGAVRFLDKSTEFDMQAIHRATTTAPVHFLARAQCGDTDGAPAPLKTLCSTCHLEDLCLPCGLTGSDVQRLDGLRFARRRIKEGQALYHEGDKFQFIYAVRSGTFKSHLALKDGREQVTGFQMAGELLGLDGLASGQHASSALALEDAEICAIPYAHLSELAAGSTDLQHVISRLMSREIVREHSLMMLLGSMNAEERLAAFLLNISQRMKARGYSASEFHLRMSRAEIGSYLGMKLETVSRTFSAFAGQRLLEVDKKHVRITDLDGLQRVFDLRVQ